MPVLDREGALGAKNQGGGVVEDELVECVE
jgi:hypothetical protein